MLEITDYENGISALDSGFVRPMLDAIHIMIEEGRAAIIDTGNYRSLPRVSEALKAKGVAPDRVEWIILTHIHLDHAGGAELMMRHFPNATLTVHPRGARHMMDPSKLMEGTIAVYGERAARRLYGELVPVPSGRILETPHGTTIKLAGRELLFLDTPGHARHHVCIVDSKTGHIFAGDTFGLSFRELDKDGRQYVFPTTSPVQFDPQTLQRSIDLIMSYKPGAIYVTHYGQVRNVAALAGDLHRLIDAHAELALRYQEARPERLNLLKQGVTDLVLEEARRYGWTLPADRVLEVFGTDIELNAMGLESWLEASASSPEKAKYASSVRLSPHPRGGAG